MNETAPNKPSLDELVFCIFSIYSMGSHRREADWSFLRLNKDIYLEKCGAAREVLSAYLEDAPKLKGYLMTLDHLENEFKKL